MVENILYIENERKRDIINFLENQKSSEKTDSQDIFSLLQEAREESHGSLEEEWLNKVKNYITSEEISTTEEQEKLANEIASKLFEGFDLSEEQRASLNNLTGREMVGLGGLIWSGIYGGVDLQGQFTNANPRVNAKNLFAKFYKDPVSMLAMGNIIYKAIQDFEDGADSGEVLALISQGSVSLYSGVKFVDSFIEAGKEATDVKSFFRALKQNYWTTNVSKTYGYSVNLDTMTISDSIEGTMDVLDSNVKLGGLDGNYKSLKSGGPVDVPDTPHIKTPDLPDIPDTPKVKTSSFKARAMGAFAIATDLAWVATALEDVITTGADAKPSQIMNLVGAIIATAGDCISMGGPIAQIVGAVVSGVGSLVAAAGGLADLTSDSSAADVGRAVGNFLLALFPLAPSIEAVERAEEMRKFRDNADNDIDKTIYGALYKIAALDATPILNLTHCIYDGELRDDARDELIDQYGNFDNMMTRYIVNDRDFQDSLNNSHEFLKNNAHTNHTQFLTAYLTPEQIKEVFKDEDYTKEGYDIRSIEDNLQVKGEYINEGYVLDPKAGMSVLPAGANMKNIDGREVLDTISLGYGKGKEVITDKDGNKIENPRVIDTATQLYYNKDQLQMFSDEFKRQHTVKEEYVVWEERQEINYGFTSSFSSTSWGGKVRGTVTKTREITDPKYARFKCWIDLVDDMSGIQTIKNNLGLYNEDFLGKNLLDIPEIFLNNLLNGANMNSLDSMYSKGEVLPDINNRVISTISDIIFPNIRTGAGNDDVILTNIERVYSDGTDSVVRVKADGGEGMDILDISHLKENDNQTFNFEYSVENDEFSFNRNIRDGGDYDWSFSDFEEIRLSDVHNKITIKEDSNINLSDGEKPEEIRILAKKSNSNKIDFSNIKGKSLYFQGSLVGQNNIKGTANDDVLTIPKDNATDKYDKQLNAINDGMEKMANILDVDPFDRLGIANTDRYAKIFGMDGNDMIIGGEFESPLGNQLYGGNGTDYIVGAGDTNRLYGENGSDFIQGSDEKGQHLLDGGLGNDIVMSGKAGAILYGGEGNDTLKGNIGIDYIDGGTGNDRITGGIGPDDFVFGKDFGKDTIEDLENFDTIKFKSSSGVRGIDDLEFIKNQEEGYLALVYDTNCIKINNWQDDTTLNIDIQNISVDNNIINELIENATSFNDYSNSILGMDEKVTTDFRSSDLNESMGVLESNPILVESPSYSTENIYTPVYSSSQLSYKSDDIDPSVYLGAKL